MCRYSPGAEKLGIRFAPHSLPACFPRGRCACKTCKKIMVAGGAGGGSGAQDLGEEFAHGRAVYKLCAFGPIA